MLRAGSSVLLSAAEDGYVAYDVGLDQLSRLNGTAALIVELCDGTRDLARLRADLEPLVGTDWPKWRDWIAQATANGLLTTEHNKNTGQSLNAATLTKLADSLQRRDRVLAAFLCQERAVKLAPDDPNGWVRLGELAHIVGRRDQARSAYQRYLAWYPDDAEIAHLVIALADSPPPSRVPNRCIEQLYSRFADFYDDNMLGELEYRAPDQLRDAVVAELGNQVQLEVLDLGCGTGLNGIRWQAHASRLVGIDLSEAMIARARSRDVYDHLETVEITAWLTRDPQDQFDLVLACDTFIYFGDLAQVIGPATHRLKHGGLLAFTVEHGDTRPFRLSDAGRFLHHPDHIADVTAASSLQLLSLSEAVVRYEYADPVTGLIAVCRR